MLAKEKALVRSSHCRVFLCLLFASFLPALAAQDPEEATKKEVWSVEARRVEALIMSDWKTLESMLSEDLVYVHSNGVVEDKAAFMKAVRTGAMIYDSMQHQEVLVRLYGKAAVITGRTQVRVRMGKNDPLDATLHVTMVYANEEGWWRLASWQTTRIPEAPPEKAAN